MTSSTPPRRSGARVAVPASVSTSTKSYAWSADMLKVMDWPSHQIEHGDYQPSTCPTCGADVMRSAAHRRRFKNKFCGRKCAANYGSRVAAERVRQ